MIDVPELVRQRALSRGEPGRRWLADLPRVVAELADRWQIILGEPYGGGTASLVVAATTADRRRCVLKVPMAFEPDDRATFERAVLAHQLAAGRGCAQLLDHDLVAPAALLEQLGPNLGDLGLELPELLDTIADTLRSYWRPVPDPTGLRSGPDHTAWLAAFITRTWNELDRPCAPAVIERALDCCERRTAGFDPRRAVLVHGDAHGWNTLAADDDTFKLVDPEGLWSEPEHDLAVPMREYNEPLAAGDTRRLVRERAERLAERCGLGAERILEWGYIERVSTGLANLRDFNTDQGHLFLEVARRDL